MSSVVKITTEGFEAPKVGAAPPFHLIVFAPPPPFTETLFQAIVVEAPVVISIAIAKLFVVGTFVKVHVPDTLVEERSRVK